jgi:hypothetical protein
MDIINNNTETLIEAGLSKNKHTENQVLCCYLGTAMQVKTGK